MSIRSERRRRGDVSLEEPIGVDRDGNEITVGDVLGTDEDAVFAEAVGRICANGLKKLINDTLDGRERSVIALRFGLDNGEPMPQREVGRLLGISRSYVSRIEKKAIEKLRDAAAKGCGAGI